LSWGRSSSLGKSVSLLEAEAGSDGSAGQVLESVEDHVVNVGLGGVANSQGDSGHVLGAVVEGLQDSVWGDLENLGWVDLTVVEDLQDVHLVLEWTDLELVQEGSLTWGDLVTLVDNLDWVDDFNLGLNNLGLNVKGLEELGLLWIKTGWTSWDLHILWSEGTNLGWGLSDLGVENGRNVSEIAVSEDETNVEDEVIVDDLHVLGVLLGFLVLLNELLEGLLHEGVLAHDHDATAGSDLLAHNTDLLGGDVVDVDEHALGVFGSALTDVLPDFVLAHLLA